MPAAFYTAEEVDRMFHPLAEQVESLKREISFLRGHSPAKRIDRTSAVKMIVDATGSGSVRQFDRWVTRGIIRTAHDKTGKWTVEREEIELLCRHPERLRTTKS